MRTSVLQFAKTPESGGVKTRLVPPLSPQQAQALHCRLVRHVATTVAAQSEVDLELWSTAGGEFLSDLSVQLGCRHERQCGEGLGERLLHALRSGLKRAQAVLLIGSDCPYITADYLSHARASLAQPDTDIVIGPAADGGYVLLGLTHAHHLLFDDIAWGTDRVLSQTRERACALALRVKQLQVLEDIDRPQDLRKLAKQLVYRHIVDGVDI